MFMMELPLCPGLPYRDAHTAPAHTPAGVCHVTFDKLVLKFTHTSKGSKIIKVTMKNNKKIKFEVLTLSISNLSS